MKRIISVFIFASIIITIDSVANRSSIDRLRKAFHESVLHPEELSVFLEVVESIQLPTPIERAYIGAAEALRARETWNPISKITHLNRFRALLAEAINEDAQNLEIRFLRYSIEFNIPKFLRSDIIMAEDKSVIMNEIMNIDQFTIDQSFIIYILTLFEDTKTCTIEEIALIKSKLKG